MLWLGDFMKNNRFLYIEWLALPDILFGVLLGFLVDRDAALLFLTGFICCLCQWFTVEDARTRPAGTALHRHGTTTIFGILRRRYDGDDVKNEI